MRRRCVTDCAEEHGRDKVDEWVRLEKLVVKAVEGEPVESREPGEPIKNEELSYFEGTMGRSACRGHIACSSDFAHFNKNLTSQMMACDCFGVVKILRVIEFGGGTAWKNSQARG